MTTWPNEDLRRIAANDDLHISPFREDGKHIWVADARGASFGLWQVTTGPYMDADPAWSPDSRFLYFSSDRSGQLQVWKAGFSFP